jgi:hypothetical protein
LIRFRSVSSRFRYPSRRVCAFGGSSSKPPSLAIISQVAKSASAFLQAFIAMLDLEAIVMSAGLLVRNRPTFIATVQARRSFRWTSVGVQAVGHSNEFMTRTSRSRGRPSRTAYRQGLMFVSVQSKSRVQSAPMISLPVESLSL